MKDTFKTIILFFVLGILLMTVGRVFIGENAMWTMLGFSILMNLGVYFYSDKIAVYSAGGVLVKKNQYSGIREIVLNLANHDNIPAPKLYISDNPQPNAFATGRNPQNSGILITTGLINNLTKEEIKGVLAHEISHIKNRDILLATVASVIASIITTIVSFAKWTMIFGGNDENKNPLAQIATILIAPIAAIIIQMAISRQREFKADESGAKLTNNPEGLASALEKIEYISKRVSSAEVNPAFANLYIASPFQRSEAHGFIQKLFSTHPPVSERVERLREIKIQ